MSGQRPPNSFDGGLQQERTALAWERTAIAMMVAGVVLARFATVEEVYVFSVIGLLQTAFGAALLVWTGAHYEDLHAPLRAGDPVVHPSAARLVGLVTVIAIGLALMLAVAVTIAR